MVFLLNNPLGLGGYLISMANYGELWRTMDNTGNPYGHSIPSMPKGFTMVYSGFIVGDTMEQYCLGTSRRDV